MKCAFHMNMGTSQRFAKCTGSVIKHNSSSNQMKNSLMTITIHFAILQTKQANYIWFCTFEWEKRLLLFAHGEAEGCTDLFRVNALMALNRRYARCSTA